VGYFLFIEERNDNGILNWRIACHSSLQYPFIKLLGHEAIVYQANPQRCDKISNPRVGQDLQLGLPRIPQRVAVFCSAESM